MRGHMELAIQNIVKHGDTDIFPFPIENHAFFDRRVELIELLLDYHANFDDYLARFSPRHASSLTPAGYSGFRWATQLDPIWNAYFLGCVLSIAQPIEATRIPKEQEIIFSYRYAPDPQSGDLFDRDYYWVRFMEKSLNLIKDYKYVVICDISEFYPRLSHHRLENALQHIGVNSDAPHRIIEFLSNFSNSRSFGLPIGGPAARILSELTLNQIDRLLRDKRITFVRFADDFHLFSNSQEEAYQQLIFLSEKLFLNQGLSLQKSKTRILTASEFKATSPIRGGEVQANEEQEDKDVAALLPARSIFKFSIRFDPYSPTAEDDYEELKRDLRRFDIIGLLTSELQKSRIHTALAKKIIQAVRFLDGHVRDEAILSILNNCEILYPIFSSVLILLDKIFTDLSGVTQQQAIEKIRKLIATQSHIMRVDVHVAYAIRVLAHVGDEETQALLERLFEERTSPIIRRDIILTIAKWRGWHWLSDLRNRFRELSGPERRAFIIASYVLGDEGTHWRKNIRDELTPFEVFTKDWASEKKKQDKNWEISL